MAFHVSLLGHRERHEMLVDSIACDFADHLKLVPSSTGLHIAALSRKASVREITAVARRAMDAGVAFQRLSAFSVDGPPRAGVVLGYGGIATAQIPEGLRRLRKCFNAG